METISVLIFLILGISIGRVDSVDEVGKEIVDEIVNDIGGVDEKYETINDKPRSFNSPLYANGRYVLLNVSNTWVCMSNIKEELQGQRAINFLNHSLEYILEGEFRYIVDSNSDTCLVATSFNNHEYGQWIMIDLGAGYPIHHINVTNKECGCENFRRISVSISNSTSHKSFQTLVEGIVDHTGFIINFAPAHLEDVCSLGSLTGPSCYINEKLVHMGDKAVLQARGSLFLVNSTVLVSSDSNSQSLLLKAAHDIHLETNSRIISDSRIEIIAETLFISSSSVIIGDRITIKTSYLHFIAGHIKATKRIFLPSALPSPPSPSSSEIPTLQPTEKSLSEETKVDTAECNDLAPPSPNSNGTKNQPKPIPLPSIPSNSNIFQKNSSLVRPAQVDEKQKNDNISAWFAQIHGMARVTGSAISIKSEILHIEGVISSSGNIP
ncbi:hypothetical protein AAMO2058_001467500 [Amorphochlora amoebiformis]